MFTVCRRCDARLRSQLLRRWARAQKRCWTPHLEERERFVLLKVALIMSSLRAWPFHKPWKRATVKLKRVSSYIKPPGRNSKAQSAFRMLTICTGSLFKLVYVLQIYGPGPCHAINIALHKVSVHTITRHVCYFVGRQDIVKVLLPDAAMWIHCRYTGCINIYRHGASC